MKPEDLWILCLGCYETLELTKFAVESIAKDAGVNLSEHSCNKMILTVDNCPKCNLGEPAHFRFHKRS